MDKNIRKLKIEPWKVVKTVYDRCCPVGMGLLQHTPGDMTREQAQSYIDRTSAHRPNYVAMDYVNGRQCKFSFEVKDGVCEIRDDRWFDHSKEELDALLTDLTAQAEEVNNG